MSEKTINKIAIKNITVGKRLRSKNVHKVGELKINIADIGLIHPISVKEDPKNKGKYLLVAGAHRLEAYKALYEEQGKEYEEIPVKVIDREKALQVELSENFFRNDLSVLEKSEHLDKYLKSNSTDTVSEALSSLAKQSKTNERTLYRYKKIGAFICDKAKETIKALDNGLDNSTRQLMYLAEKCEHLVKADEKQSVQEQVLEMVQKKPDLKVQEAHDKLLGRKKQSSEMTSVKFSKTLKTELKTLAKEKEVPEVQFTQELLAAALNAYKNGLLKL